MTAPSLLLNYFRAQLTAGGVDVGTHLLAKSRAEPVRVQEVEKFFQGTVRRRRKISLVDGIERN